MKKSFLTKKIPIFIILLPLLIFPGCNEEAIAGMIGKFVGYGLIIYGFFYLFNDIKKKRKNYNKYNKGNHKKT